MDESLLLFHLSVISAETILAGLSAVIVKMFCLTCTVGKINNSAVYEGYTSLMV